MAIHRPRAGWLLIVLVLVAAAIAADPAPVPSEAQVAEARKLIEQVFSQELSQRTPEDARALSQRMYFEATRAEGSPAFSYALFQYAIQLAVASGDTAFAMEVIDAGARAFQRDSLQWKVELLTPLSKSLRSQETVDGFVSASLDAIEHAMELRRYDDGDAVAALVRPLIRRVSDGKLRQRATGAMDELAGAREAVARVMEARRVLAGSAEDQGANLVVGEDLGFRLNDWQRALPHLTRSSIDAIRTAAKRDLSARRDSAEELLSAGHAWWDLSAGEAMTDAQRRGYRARAAALYREALPRLGGLPRDIVRQRLREIGQDVWATRATAPGLVARVFAGQKFERLTHREIHSTLSHDWQRRSPHRTVDPDAFSVHWSGYLIAPRNGVYGLRIRADDHATIWINDRFVVSTASAEVEVRLVKGLNPIRVEYSEGEGDASIDVRWRPPTGNSYDPIPAESLTHDPE